MDGTAFDRRDFLRSLGVSGAGVALAGCTGGPDDGDRTNGGDRTSGGQTRTSTGQTIKIGAITALSGPFTPWGQSSLAGAQLAASELSESAEFDGEIEILSADSQSDAGEAASIFDRFASEGAVSMMGMTSSDVMLRLREKSEEREIPQFVNTPGTKQLLPRDTRYTFRLNLGSIDMVSQAIAELVEGQGYQRVGAIVADYAWGHAVKQAIETYVEPIEGVETEVLTAPVGASDFNSYVRQLRDFDPDAMMVSGHPPGAGTIAKTQFELGLDPEITLGVALHAPIWRDVLRDDVYRGIVEWSPFDPTGDGYLAFAKRFYESEERYADQYVAVGYSAVKLIAASVAESGSTDPTTIAKTARDLDYETFFAYPFSFTDWGELDRSRVVFTSFERGEPPGGINPGADWHLTEFATSSRLEPPEPPESR